MKRKKLTRKQSKQKWQSGNGTHKANTGIYTRRNRGGVRF